VKIRPLGIFLFAAASVVGVFSGRGMGWAEEKVVNPYMKHINPDVQLKENGWVKIINEIYWEETWGEYGKRLFGSGIERPAPLRDRIMRNLNVKFQFLKQCNARSKRDEYMSNFTEPMTIIQWNNVLKMTREGRYIIGYKEVIDMYKNGKIEEWKDRAIKLDSEYPDFFDFDLPRFMSNYHTKIFVTYFAIDGTEINTESKFPIAYYTDASKKIRKTEMLPGETTYLDFNVPDDAIYWYVWVPK